jgi:hypothetical protein
MRARLRSAAKSLASPPAGSQETSSLWAVARIVRADANQRPWRHR